MNGVEPLIRLQPDVARHSERIISIWLSLFIVMVVGCDLLSSGEDLASQGSVTLVYEIDLAAAKHQGTTVDTALMDKMVASLVKRINPKGVKGFVVQPLGTDRIEITIPGTNPDRVQQTKALIARLGTLEFSIVANDHNDEALIGHAMRLSDSQNELATEINGQRRVAAVWHDLSDSKDNGEFWSGVGFRKAARIDPDTGTKIEVPQILVKHDPPERAVTGAYLKNVRAVTDENGSLAVSFTLNSKGGALFNKLTGDNLPDKVDNFKQRLAILLDGKVYSAPNIMSVISANGQITGRFTKQEIDDLVAVLNAGVLPVPLKPIPVSETTTSPPPKTDAPK